MEGGDRASWEAAKARNESRGERSEGETSSPHLQAHLRENGERTHRPRMQMHEVGSGPQCEETCSSDFLDSRE